MEVCESVWKCVKVYESECGSADGSGSKPIDVVYR
jgi:hypothetical protein